MAGDVFETSGGPLTLRPVSLDAVTGSGCGWSGSCATRGSRLILRPIR